MNVLQVSWYTLVLVEANKFWFYAICASIARTLGQLLAGSPFAVDDTNSQAASKKEQSAPVKRPSKPGRPSRTRTVQRLVIDGCDMLLPASFIGWTRLGDLEVGLAMIVSSLLAWGGVWAAAQQVNRGLDGQKHD